jgi:AcrR family transcriptional regulator
MSSVRDDGRVRDGKLDSAIIRIAWEQIARSGAANLSLRAISRELGVTAPAIYHYFPSRDDLITALIIEAFDSFGAAQARARDTVSRTDPRGQLAVLSEDYRNWALDHPQRYQLIFGAPIAGYEPNPDRLAPSGVRAIRPLVEVVATVHEAGGLLTGDIPIPSPDREWSVEVWRAILGDIPEVCLAVAVSIWARAHGLVSLEINGRIPPFGPDGGALFRHEMAALRRQYLGEGAP